MKALTLQDDAPKNPTPWLTLVEYDLKKIETRRNWMNRSHRGDTLLTASATSRTPNAGKAVCVVDIYDIVPMTTEHELDACIEVFEFAWALKTRNLRWLSRKFPVKGTLGIFDVEMPADVTLREASKFELSYPQYPFYLKDIFSSQFNFDK